MIAYLGLQLLYALWLKHEPVLDISIVAAGFLMRAVAGGIAADLPLSQWFLLVSGFGSLFIVAGKRYSELHTLGSESGTRRSLVRYTDTYLRFVWSIAAGATVISYSLWAFEQAPDSGIPWHTISIAPFVMGMLRYAVDVDAGTASEPEDIVFRDRVLQLIGVAWLVTVCLGVLVDMTPLLTGWGRTAPTAATLVEASRRRRPGPAPAAPRPGSSSHAASAGPTATRRRTPAAPCSPRSPGRPPSAGPGTARRWSRPRPAPACTT